MERPLTSRIKLLGLGRLESSEMVRTIIDIEHSEFIHDDDVIQILVPLIRHRDPDVRSEVIGVFAYHGVTFDWDVEPGKTLLAAIGQMATHDSDRDCHLAAVAGLGSLMCGTRNEFVANLLAEIVKRPTEEDAVRSFAYCSFLGVMGIPVNEQTNPLRLKIGTDELQRVERDLRTLQRKAD